MTARAPFEVTLPRRCTAAEAARLIDETAADVREAEAAITVPRVRLTEAELNAAERRVRADIAAIEHQPRTAYRHHVAGALEALGYDVEHYRGFPSLQFANVNAADLMQDAMRLGALLAQHEPRRMESIFTATRCDVQAQRVWWELPRWEEEES